MRLECCDILLKMSMFFTHSYCNRADAIQRKFVITKALLCKADRSSFDRIRQQVGLIARCLKGKLCHTHTPPFSVSLFQHFRYTSLNQSRNDQRRMLLFIIGFNNSLNSHQHTRRYTNTLNQNCLSLMFYYISVIFFSHSPIYLLFPYLKMKSMLILYHKPCISSM